jgi:Ino eighty subunit 2
MVEDVGQPEPVAPKMYRWLSSVQSAQHAEGEKKSVITFSVPIDAVQDHLSGGQANVQAIPRPAASRPRCDISGCDSPRKYRMARDFERGACGMPHLKILEGYVSTAVG